MKKKISAGFLALVFLLQAFLPSLVYANQASPQDTKIISEDTIGPDNVVTLGKLKGVGFSQGNPTASITIEEVKEKNHKNTDALDGLEISDENIPQALMSSNSPYIQGQQPADPDKPKYWANVKGKLTTVGLDGGSFDWNKVLGQGAKVKLLFTQTNGNVMTGVTYTLLVDKDGTYTWQGNDGKPTYLPLFDVDGNPYTYNVQIERNYDKNVQLIIQESNGTPKAKFRQEGDKQVATISFLDIGIQQVASTKFVSEWHTALAEGDRPQIEGYFKADTDIDNDFNFPKNDTTRTILRSSFVENFEEDEDNGPWSFLSSEIEKTPKTVEVKTDTQGLTFKEVNGVKTVKSGDHKFKYEFTYDVINGGKLIMTEIIPVTFDANGGKFANFTAPDTETKIVKEVDYEGTLTDKAEDPTKERETFKGWSTTKDGTPLTEEEFNKAIKNVKEAKTFYAIWDNNDIVAKELEVKESFKDGTGYVNDFIPTLDQLKVQVKIKDASGTPQALANDDKIEILGDDGKPIADAAALKTYLYDKLKEDPNTEVSRNVILKAKVTRGDGIIQEVTIPIKVVKNIYEAKTEEGKPNYVPKDYVKVTVDPTTKAEKPQKYFYYVNPKAKVVIPGEDPTATGDNKFVKWTYDDNGTETEYKLADKPRHMFTADTTIEAQYVSDVIPANDDGSKPDTVPANYVEVKFVPTDKAKDTAEKIYWVNPDKKVTIPVKDPVAKLYFSFKEWKFGENANGDVYDPTVAKQFDKKLTIITATYNDSKDIIPVDPTNPKAKPEGYVTVTFDADLGLKLTGTKYYYVKANSGITIGRLKKPEYKEASGYEFNGWDKLDSTPIGKEDIVVTALAKFTPSKPDDRPDRPYPEIIYRDKIVEKEKIVEKIVKVGENDELLKEIRYMQGYNGKFRPYDGLTRAEAAQILANALKADGYRYDANYALSYSDVGSKWYTDAVRVVTQANVFQGYSDGTFRPQGKITRAEWVATLRRFQDLKKESGNTMMLRSGHWATEEVEAAYQAGWLGVYQDGTAKFDADKPITRQEVAYVSNRAFRRVLDKVYLKRSVNTLLTYKDINPSMPLYEDILCASNTLLTDGRYYKANTIVMDNVTFNIVTDYLRISQKKFQYNVIR